MYNITYLPLAETDILDAVDYIAGKLDAPQAAQALLDELDDTVERISKYPYAHELYRTARPMPQGAGERLCPVLCGAGEYRGDTAIPPWPQESAGFGTVILRMARAPAW